jgi:hypothetical protein
MRRAGLVARIVEKRILVGKPEGKRSLGRPRRRCMNSIKMNLKRDAMGWYGLD